MINYHNTLKKNLLDLRWICGATAGQKVFTYQQVEIILEQIKNINKEVFESWPSNVHTHLPGAKGKCCSCGWRCAFVFNNGFDDSCTKQWQRHAHSEI